MHDIKAQIKQDAMDAGFTLAGITTSEPLHGYPRYEAWIGKGFHGEMSYLASERGLFRRADPRRIMPECRSILMLATAYQPPGCPTQQDASSPSIARYALGRDYHLTLIERMEALRTSIEHLVGKPVKAMAYTDTGPLLERELAQRAGLGWIGRNSMLIHPSHGSYLLLSEILLDLELEPDPPFEKDLCGTCRRCVEACPTTCIREDRTLDARRCISYLTIEKRGAIPVDLREAIGNNLFGCDTCQAVCPWNRRFGTETADPAFQPAPDRLSPSLTTYLTLNPSRWRAPFKESPLLRAKREGLVRNAAVVAGNLQDEESIPALGHALLKDPGPAARELAAWALGQYTGQEQARDYLQTAAETETNSVVLTTIQIALETLDEQEHRPG